MKIKKTITDKVVAANKKNSQKSTGPQNTNAVKQNACKHGMLAKHLFFQNDEEKVEFETLLGELVADQNASGLLEKILVEEAAISIWKMRISDGWDIKELAKRRSIAKAVLETVAEGNDDERLLLNSYGDKAAQRGWDCQELTIRTGSKKDEEDNSMGTTSMSGQVHMEAKLTPSLDTVMRYRSIIKRDLYRAISALREMRRARDEQGGL